MSALLLPKLKQHENGEVLSYWVVNDAAFMPSRRALRWLCDPHRVGYQSLEGHNMTPGPNSKYDWHPGNARGMFKKCVFGCPILEEGQWPEIPKK